MKFGFDIDDTLINLREHAFYIYNKKLNKNVSLDDFYALKRVEIHEPFGLTDDEGKKMWNDTLEEIYYTNCPAFPNAVETLNKLVHEGHEIYYITSRPKEHGERTKEWMKKQGFPVQDDCFFYGMQDDEKVDIIQKLQLDYYFDDKPAVLDTLSTDSVKVIVKDQSYNRGISLPRLINWTDLQRIL
ncbi:5' nucleotidase, NT5C type [Niallia endozanthoxylica]|uniref:Nucleotidase n=1 Tax=Niallia endozanthoxylica TaxID=2036016 RepID=A0A5J5HPI3_9BACI|nr:HAD family acid phosphatase [Niallia endozanthoxylica]KAA9021748.1 HAD hydrolase-like protein [Niallia endozanthoxylica]